MGPHLYLPGGFAGSHPRWSQKHVLNRAGVRTFPPSKPGSVVSKNLTPKRRTEMVADLREQNEASPASDYELMVPEADRLALHDPDPGTLINPERSRKRARNLSVSEQIAALTKDGIQITTFMVAVMKGAVKGLSPRDRMDAAKWLGERYWGKTPDTVLHAHAHAVADIPNEVTNEVLRQVARGHLPPGTPDGTDPKGGT